MGIEQGNTHLTLTRTYELIVDVVCLLNSVANAPQFVFGWYWYEFMDSLKICLNFLFSS